MMKIKQTNKFIVSKEFKKNLLSSSTSSTSAAQ